MKRKLQTKLIELIQMQMLMTKLMLIKPNKKKKKNKMKIMTMMKRKMMMKKQKVIMIITGKTKSNQRNPKNTVDLKKIKKMILKLIKKILVIIKKMKLMKRTNLILLVELSMFIPMLMNIKNMLIIIINQPIVPSKEEAILNSENKEAIIDHLSINFNVI